MIIDELGDLPFADSGGRLLFHLISKLYERTSIIFFRIRCNLTLFATGFPGNIPMSFVTTLTKKSISSPLSVLTPPLSAELAIATCSASGAPL